MSVQVPDSTAAIHAVTFGLSRHSTVAIVQSIEHWPSSE